MEFRELLTDAFFDLTYLEAEYVLFTTLPLKKRYGQSSWLEHIYLIHIHGGY